MKPLQILLVDDEHFVIRGINSLIDWEGNGFPEPLADHSGEAALALMERQPVDIVDHRCEMAPMDGLGIAAGDQGAGDTNAKSSSSACHSEYAYSARGHSKRCLRLLFKPEMMPRGYPALRGSGGGTGFLNRQQNGRPEDGATSVSV
jgi:two-component system response regulator YesN